MISKVFIGTGKYPCLENDKFQINSCVGADRPDGMVTASFDLFHIFEKYSSYSRKTYEIYCKMFLFSGVLLGEFYTPLPCMVKPPHPYH